MLTCSKCGCFCDNAYLINGICDDCKEVERKEKNMDKRYFIKVGNCFVEFIGLWHEVKMRSDYKKATPYITKEKAKEDAIQRGIRNFKIVERDF